MSSITTHPDQASSKLLINSQIDSLLLLVICEKNKMIIRTLSTGQNSQIKTGQTLRWRSVSLDFSLSQSIV